MVFSLKIEPMMSLRANEDELEEHPRQEAPYMSPPGDAPEVPTLRQGQPPAQNLSQKPE